MAMLYDVMLARVHYVCMQVFTRRPWGREGARASGE